MVCNSSRYVHLVFFIHLSLSITHTHTHTLSLSLSVTPSLYVSVSSRWSSSTPWARCHLALHNKAQLHSRRVWISLGLLSPPLSLGVSFPSFVSLCLLCLSVSPFPSSLCLHRSFLSLSSPYLYLSFSLSSLS